MAVVSRGKVRMEEGGMGVGVRQIRGREGVGRERVLGVGVQGGGGRLRERVPKQQGMLGEGGEKEDIVDLLHR